MLDPVVGDNQLNVSSATDQSDFQCQVGDSRLVTPIGSSYPEPHLRELLGVKDVQCQANTLTSDFQCQAKSTHATQVKGTTSDVHCQAYNLSSSVHCQAELGVGGLLNLQHVDTPRPTKTTKTRSTSMEVRPQVSTRHCASQCDLLSRTSSSSVHCQAGGGATEAGAGRARPKVKVSASADFQCQVGVAKTDFQSQFGESGSA